ncbi:MAG: efflux RND transporter periplasmic adaptor subunit [Gemmatimonadetes bacterium]|nr:efflux RND transporter periplasmic adaptor subunit [Gemmatimonadota bacterium]
MKTSSKWAIAVVAVVAVVSVLVLMARGRGIDVTVERVQRDTLSVSIAVEGRTQARESYTVTAPVSGRLNRLRVEEGDAIVAGQLLARLVPAPEDPRTLAALRAEVERAEAQLRGAQAQLREAGLQRTQAEREVERRRPLFEMGGLSREALEQAELAAVVAGERLEAAQASAAAAEGTLAGARARLVGAESGAATGTTELQVRAPVSGRVVDVPDPSERVVQAGTPLLVLADTEGLEVVLDVLSEDAVRIQASQPLLVTRWGGEGTLSGRVRTVTMAGYTKVSTLGVEEQRVDVVADIDHPPAALGTGYRVSGHVVVWRGDDVMVIPTSAVFRLATEWRVFVVEEGRARERAVDIGRRNERRVEIREGLVEDETVILFPSEAIEDGVRVRPSG